MLAKALSAATAAAAEKLYVENVFSTWLYTGNGSTQTINNGIALGDGVEIAPGTALGGGYFAGFISHTANGVPTHALIVAPRATGASGTGYTITTDLQWQTSGSTTGATSPFDGAANTALMTSSPAANFCTGLSIGGYSDWYLPARFELDIAYYNLKPTTSSNNTSWGINDYSVPKRTANYTAGDPAQTSIAAFQSIGAESFVPFSHWSSTEDSSTFAWELTFSNGFQFNTFNKTNNDRVRAFRRIPISDPLLDPYRVMGKGGLVWYKSRNNAVDNALFDTVRGAGKLLISNTTAAEGAGYGQSFTSSGFSLTNGGTFYNGNGYTYASWTFRKAAKFFDVVTYTGTGSNRTVAHNLGSVPGCIIVKRTDTTGDWQVYHRANTANPETDYLVLNSTAATADSDTRWNDTLPTSTVFSLGTDATVNASGGTYVAYLFAHDAGGFGDAGTDNVVSCGSYTGNGADPGPTITLGWEPQWLLIKNATYAGGGWILHDTMRGITMDVDEVLRANTSAAAVTVGSYVNLTPTGFQLAGANQPGNESWNRGGDTFIYIAIRRGPMKTPTVGTEVFGLNARSGTGANATVTGGQVDDAVLIKNRGSAVASLFSARLTGTGYLVTSSTAPEVAAGTTILQANPWDVMDGVKVGTTSTITNASSNTFVNYLFRRAPGFFDVVAYTGTGGELTLNHNLGVIPELWIVKPRAGVTQAWLVGGALLGSSTASRLLLNSNVAVSSFSNLFKAPTSTTFGIGPFGVTADLSVNGATYIAYLFASCPGVSKVGSYTGTGTTLDVDCGFTNGSRLVLIKRTDSTGDWYVWDTARGIVSGNDPYLLLNSTAAEVTNTDFIDPLSSGFQISSTAPAAINANGGTYIFLAIA